MASTAKGLMTLAALAAAALIGVSCGGDDDDGSSGGKAKLTFWHGQTELWADCLATQIAEFNRTHKNIQVSSDTGGVVADRMLQKVTAGLQAGNYPDVAYVFGSVKPVRPMSTIRPSMTALVSITTSCGPDRERAPGSTPASAGISTSRL